MVLAQDGDGITDSNDNRTSMANPNQNDFDSAGIATFGSILTISCVDRPGVVHAVSGFLLEHGGNIEEAAQYHDKGWTSPLSVDTQSF